MTTIVTRAGKGSALTHTEMDDNFTNLQTSIDTPLDGVTGGTVTASKAVVVDANKDIGDFRYVTATEFIGDLDAASVLHDGVTATTQSADDNSTKVATTAYTDTQVASVTPEAYTSSWYTITSGALVSGSALAHGLSGAPQIVQHQLKCTDAGGEDGYSQNDIVQITDNSPLNSRGVSVTIDATNLTIRYGSDSNTFDILSKGGGDNNTITNSKWQYRVIAVYHP